MVNGSMPPYSGWFSGNDARSGSGPLRTGAPTFSANATPASQPPAAIDLGTEDQQGPLRAVDPVGEVA